MNGFDFWGHAKFRKESVKRCAVLSLPIPEEVFVWDAKHEVLLVLQKLCVFFSVSTSDRSRQLRRQDRAVQNFAQKEAYRKFYVSRETLSGAKVEHRDATS